MTKKIIAVDPGPIESGVLFLTNGQITSAQNLENVGLVPIILSEWDSDTHVVIEDIKPYSIALKQTIIDTCKWIGQLEYRLKTAHVAYTLISRSEVKQWIFNTFPAICAARIIAKRERRAFLACDRITRVIVRVQKDGSPWKPRKPWYGAVDDRIVIACMKDWWKIETPKPGKVNRLGVSRHAWQALALATVFRERMQVGEHYLEGCQLSSAALPKV